jgi:hypothetical protein
MAVDFQKMGDVAIIKAGGNYFLTCYGASQICFLKEYVLASLLLLSF